MQNSPGTLWLSSLATVLCAAVLAACGGGGGGSVAPAATSATPTATPAAQAVRTPGPVASHFFSPTTTDANITTDTLADRSYAPTFPDNSTLLIWLPGQGAAPGAYTTISAFAASVGYHVVAVDYPNANAPATFCTNNLSCYSGVYLEKWDGRAGAETPAITPSNSISNRIIKMLAYLAQTYPAENWGQFLTGGTVTWSNTVIAGHSLGSMTAAAVAHSITFKRVVLFAGPEDGITQVNGTINTPTYMSAASATPLSAHYLFWHLLDTFYPQIVANATALGMDAYGPYTSVDGASAPYGNSHELTTNVAAADPHHAVAFDGGIPTDTNGNPVYVAAWTYLFGP
jgi:pimeloyl-ACP methyl ester carboxylesterase